jgi:hypothetical protein
MHPRRSDQRFRPPKGGTVATSYFLFEPASDEDAEDVPAFEPDAVSSAWWRPPALGFDAVSSARRRPPASVFVVFDAVSSAR